MLGCDDSTCSGKHLGGSLQLALTWQHARGRRSGPLYERSVDGPPVGILPKRHRLGAGGLLVGQQPCSCGGHTTWTCECGAGPRPTAIDVVRALTRPPGNDQWHMIWQLTMREHRWGHGAAA